MCTVKCIKGQFAISNNSYITIKLEEHSHECEVLSLREFSFLIQFFFEKNLTGWDLPCERAALERRACSCEPEPHSVQLRLLLLSSSVALTPLPDAWHFLVSFRMPGIPHVNF